MKKTHISIEPQSLLLFELLHHLALPHYIL